MTTSHFKVDSSLRWNVGTAFALLIICPLALWQFHFRLNASEIVNEITPAQRVAGFYKAFDKTGFNAEEFFATEVVVFDTVTDTNPEAINEMIASDRKNNMFPRTVVDTKTIVTAPDENGNTTVTAWTHCICYRKSIVKYVSYDIQRTITFDKQNKITAFETIEIRNTTTSFVMPE